MKNLVTDGEAMACDENGLFELKLPEWVDEKRVKR